MALLVGWLSAFGRHTVTGAPLTLGLGEADWTAWHRRFNQGRVDDDRLTGCLLAQTMPLSPGDGPDLVGSDVAQIPRHSSHRQ